VSDAPLLFPDGIVDGVCQNDEYSYSDYTYNFVPSGDNQVEVFETSTNYHKICHRTSLSEIYDPSISSPRPLTPDDCQQDQYYETATGTCQNADCPVGYIPDPDYETTANCSPAPDTNNTSDNNNTSDTNSTNSTNSTGTGDTGSTGNSGSTGGSGTGDSGSTGGSGTTGDTGSSGSSGAGDTGSTGGSDTGNAGSTGSTGSTGTTGSSGSTTGSTGGGGNNTELLGDLASSVDQASSSISNHIDQSSAAIVDANHETRDAVNNLANMHENEADADAGFLSQFQSFYSDLSSSIANVEQSVNDVKSAISGDYVVSFPASGNCLITFYFFGKPVTISVCKYAYIIRPYLIFILNVYFLILLFRLHLFLFTKVYRSGA
jgi:hypothetical protein